MKTSELTLLNHLLTLNKDMLQGIAAKLNALDTKMEHLIMLESEAKAALDQVIADQTASQALLAEGFAELNARIQGLEDTIDQMIADQANKPIDAGLQASLETVLRQAGEVKAQAQALADVVPNAPVEVPPVEVPPVDPNALPGEPIA